MSRTQKAEEAIRIVADLSDRLSNDREIQGCVLCELLALHLGGYPVQQRDDVLRRIVVTTLHLASINDAV